MNRRCCTLLCVITAAACSAGANHNAPRVPVTVARAESRDFPFTIEATGTVEPRQTAAVQAQVTGVVTRVAFHEGDDVAAGQLLFQIDPRPFQASLAQARAQLVRDSAQADQAQREADRYADLVKQDYVTQQDAEEKRSNAAALNAAVRADSAAVGTAQLNLDYAAVRAPIGGRTGALLVREGNLVRSNTQVPLVVINQIEPILVRFAVPQTTLPVIQKYRKAGLPVYASATASDTAPSAGGLTFVDNAVDTTTGTVLLKAEFPNRDHALWPGEYVSTKLVLYVESHATVVPAAAVTAGQNGSYVFVVNADQSVQFRPVTVERQADGYDVIASGLKAGETVVTDGQLRLAAGVRVDIKQGATQGGAPAPTDR